MPALEYYLVCTNVHEDILTRDISLINVLDDISPERFPHAIPQIFGVSLWRLRPDEIANDYQATLVVKVPGKNDVTFPMNLQRKGNRCRALQCVEEIPLDMPGILEFEVLLNGEHAATHKVIIHQPEILNSDGNVSRPV